MFVRNSTWYRIRPEFTEAEKGELSAAVVTESICPPGLIVDARQVRPELISKLQTAMARVAPGA